jgi:hypothetical protein
MHKTRAFMALAALTSVSAAAEEKFIRYDGQQVVLDKPIDSTLLAGNEEKSAALSAARTTRCPHHDNPTTLFTTSSTSSQSLASEPTETASDAELNDKGAAGPVAKASLFPLVVGLAAAVVML